MYYIKWYNFVNNGWLIYMHISWIIGVPMSRNKVKYLCFAGLYSKH